MVTNTVQSQQGSPEPLYSSSQIRVSSSTTPHFIDSSLMLMKDAFQDNPKNQIICKFRTRFTLFQPHLLSSHLPSQAVITVTLYWSMIEVGLAVVAACLPTLRPLFASLSSGVSLSHNPNKSTPSRPSLPLSGNLSSPRPLLSPRTPDGGSTSSRSPFLLSSPWRSLSGFGVQITGKEEHAIEMRGLDERENGSGLGGLEL